MKIKYFLNLEFPCENCNYKGKSWYECVFIIKGSIYVGKTHDIILNSPFDMLLDKLYFKNEEKFGECEITEDEGKILYEGFQKYNFHHNWISDSDLSHSEWC